jgi:hypothetical protein
MHGLKILMCKAMRDRFFKFYRLFSVDALSHKIEPVLRGNHLKIIIMAWVWSISLSVAQHCAYDTTGRDGGAGFSHNPLRRMIY